MTHRVIVARPVLMQVPTDVLEQAEERFREIAEGLEGIAADSPFWASTSVSQLRLVVWGWSFLYSLDGQTLRVTEARQA